MDQRLSLVTLGVSDLERSRRFYEALGWKPGFARSDVVFFQAGGMIIGLWSKDSLAADARLPAAPAPGAIALAQNQGSRAQVDELLAAAERAGARILKPAEETEWGGYSGYFADPDGHPWEIAFNPHWKLGPDGTVHL